MMEHFTRKAHRVMDFLGARFRRLKGRWKAFRDRRAQAAEVPRILADLPGIADSLESVMSGVEPRFLDLGGELQSLSADANSLADLTRRSARAIGGGQTGDSFLENLDAAARSALAELEDCRNGIMENLNTIDLGLQYLGKLVNICSTIDQIGMSLNVVGLNIAVESSRSPEALGMFESFTDEIRKLSGRISRISQSILKDSGSTRARQMGAQDEILKALFTYNKLTRGARKVVEVSVGEIRDILELSMEALNRSNRHSREISDQVGEVVVAIQFHDIARQKIEHIAGALRELDGTSGEKTDDDHSAPAAGRVGKVVGLQAAQLKEVIDEIRVAHDKSASAFHSLDRFVEDLVTDVSLSEGDDQLEEGRLQGRIGALKLGLEQLRELLDQGHHLEDRIQATAEQVSDAASSLSEHIDQVRSISMDLHLKALNAVVKSARLQEEGRTLEVLAQEVSKLSMRAGGFVTEVVDILQALVALSLEMELGSFEDDDAETDSAIDAAIREISQQYEQSQSEAQAALDSSRALRSEIHSTGDRLVFLDELSKDLFTYLNQLQTKKERLAAWTDSDARDEKDALDQVARRYTMESERRLHSRQVGSAPGIPASPEEDVAVLDPEELVFPDLFEEDVECPENPENSSENSPENSDDDEDLGDNVELF